MGKATDTPFSYGPYYDASTGKRPLCVGIRCRCGNEDHAAAPGPAYGRRIFKQRGWRVADKMGRHECPSCVASKKESRVTEYAPIQPMVVLPPEAATPPPTLMQERMTEAASRFAKAGALGYGRRGATDGFATPGHAAIAGKRAAIRNGVSDPRRDKHYVVAHDEAGKFKYVLLKTPADLETVTKWIKATPRFSAATTKKSESFGVSPEDHVFGREWNANRSAIKYLIKRGITEPREGVHYAVVSKVAGQYKVRLLDPRAGAKPLAKDEPLTKNHGYLSQFDAKKAVFGHFHRVGRTTGAPVEGVDYWYTQDASNYWGYSLTNPNPPPAAPPAPPPEPVKEIQMTDVSSQAVRDHEDAMANPPAAVRQPTIADNRRVRNAVEEVYDEEGQMYQASWSDKKLAEHLDVPRAWVTRAREMYGPDRNNEDAILAEAAKLRAKQKLAETIALAETAMQITQSVMEAGAKLEGLLADLKAKQAELGL